MSTACAVVVHQSGVSKAKLTTLVRRTVPGITALRRGREGGLHWVVIVDERTLAVPEKRLAAVNAQLPHDAPLSAIVQAAWTLARPTAVELLERAAGSHRYEGLARELSNLTGTSWLIERSSSRRCVARRFDHGVGGALTRTPANALGCSRTELEHLLSTACSKTPEPPVLSMRRGIAEVPFQPDAYERALR